MKLISKDNKESYRIKEADIKISNNSKGLFRFRTEHRRYLPFLIPSLIVMAIILVYPLLDSIRLSFYDYYLAFPPPKFAGFKNFIDIVNRPMFWLSLRNTFIFAGFGLVIELIIGLGLALLLNRDDLRVRSLFLTILLLPLVITPVVGGLFMKWMFMHGWGLLNYFLSFVGISGPAWLGVEKTAMAAIIMADGWTYIPFVLLVLLAGLQSISSETVDAAKIDGAGRMGVFRYIVIPTLKPLILFVLMIRFMDLFRAFDQIMVMTRGGPGAGTTTITLYNYFETFQKLQIGAGSALGTITLLILSVLIIIMIKVMYGQQKGEW
jgi:multiple sugar transport system permease protein